MRELQAVEQSILGGVSPLIMLINLLLRLCWGAQVTTYRTFRKLHNLSESQCSALSKITLTTFTLG